MWLQLCAGNLHDGKEKAFELRFAENASFVNACFCREKGKDIYIYIHIK